MDRERAWARVQLALDERRDPLDDAWIQEWFAAEPLELAAYAQLELRLDALSAGVSAAAEHAPHHHSTTTAHRRLVAVCATLVTTLLIVLFAPTAPVAGISVRPPGQAEAIAPRILTYRLTATLTDGVRNFRASRSLTGPLHISDSYSESITTTADVGVRQMRHTLNQETNR